MTQSERAVTYLVLFAFRERVRPHSPAWKAEAWSDQHWDILDLVQLPK
jgi:hypothetical protein